MPCSNLWTVPLHLKAPNSISPHTLKNNYIPPPNLFSLQPQSFRLQTLNLQEPSTLHYKHPSPIPLSPYQLVSLAVGPDHVVTVQKFDVNSRDPSTILKAFKQETKKYNLSRWIKLDSYSLIVDGIIWLFNNSF